MKKTLFALLLLPCIAKAQQTDVLFIGNSYTYVNDLPGLFRNLALSMGDTVNVGSSAPGGYTFQQHSTYAPTLAAINQQPWDLVVLQEQSQRPAFPIGQVQTEVFPFAAQLVDSILAHDSCTQPVFYMTWGRQNGDVDNCASWPPVCTYDGMQALLHDRYVQMAEDNAAFAAPVGSAWKVVRDTHPLINLYASDGSHPSPEGSYLAASVFYCTLFRRTCGTATYNFSLDPDTAAILREIASSTVLNSSEDWNIGVNDPDASFTWSTNGMGDAQFTHGGNGQHSWDFGDGSSSSEASPIHHFGSGGSYNVDHVWTDGCGRTDTAQVQISFVITGISTISDDEPFSLNPIGDGMARANLSDRTSGVLSVVDELGRTVFTGRVVRNGQLLELPNGLALWRFTASDGSTWTGRTGVH
jgi:hypothetical protein